MEELAHSQIKDAKIWFAVSLVITYLVLVGITVVISLGVHVWAPWWAYVLEALVVVLIGWDMTTWQGCELTDEMP